MRVRQFLVQIWFLDEDLSKSAQMLDNKRLNSSIDGIIKAVVDARLWCAGIRSAKFYMHYFGKDKIIETMDKLFPCWPLKRPPGFLKFDSKESKWTRMCKNHYDYVLRYLECLFTEYAYRFKREHESAQFTEWELVDAPKISLKEAKLSKIVLPWKNINPKYRSKDIIESYRRQYKSIIGHPIEAYQDVPRDIPEWITKDYIAEM